MSTTHFRLKPQTISGFGIITKVLILLILIVLSGLVSTIHYLTGNFVFFVGLFIFVVFGFRKFQGRNLFLLISAHLLVMATVFNVAVVSPPIRQLAANYLGFMDVFPATVLLSMLIGILAAALVVTISFFVVLTAATVALSKWYRNAGASFSHTLLYLLRAILGISPFLLVIKDGEIEGEEEDQKLLEIFGGPGWLIIHPAQVVVLEHHGKITRVEGAGSVMLNHSEKIKAILPLLPRGGFQTIENVLTRDRISLTLGVVHAVQLEPAKETKKRLEQAVKDGETELQEIKNQNGSQDDIKAAEEKLKEAEQKLNDLANDKVVGDDDDQCYESVAKVAARKAPDVWKALKVPVENNMRDVIMAEHSDNLFKIEADNEDLEARIDQRKIAKIEKIVSEKAKKAKIGNGVVLRVVDIQTVCFPKEIEAKINEVAKSLINERIEEIEARTKVANAQSEQKKVEFEAKSEIIEARAKAQARILQGQGEGEARAALFREILRGLKQEGLSQNQIADATIELINATTSVKELEDFFKATAMHQRLSNSGGKSGI